MGGGHFYVGGGGAPHGDISFDGGDFQKKIIGWGQGIPHMTPHYGKPCSVF